MGSGSKVAWQPVVCDAQPRGLDFHALPKEFGEGTGNEKSWAHTFGELACYPLAWYRPPASDCRSGGFKDKEVPSPVSEQFFTAQPALPNLFATVAWPIWPGPVGSMRLACLARPIGTGPLWVPA